MRITDVTEDSEVAALKRKIFLDKHASLPRAHEEYIKSDCPGKSPNGDYVTEHARIFVSNRENHRPSKARRERWAVERATAGVSTPKAQPQTDARPQTVPSSSPATDGPDPAQVARILKEVDQAMRANGGAGSSASSSPTPHQLPARENSHSPSLQLQSAQGIGHQQAIPRRPTQENAPNTSTIPLGRVHHAYNFAVAQGGHGYPVAPAQHGSMIPQQISTPPAGSLREQRAYGQAFGMPMNSQQAPSMTLAPTNRYEAYTLPNPLRQATHGTQDVYTPVDPNTSSFAATRNTTANESSNEFASLDESSSEDSSLEQLSGEERARALDKIAEDLDQRD